LLPWATAEKAEPKTDLVRDIPELRGGNWLRGREVFRSDESSCARCHKVRGEGGDIGPDLSNLVHRDYASVLRDIVQPSYAIHPDYLTQVVELRDGRTFTGALRSKGDQMILGDASGKEYVLRREDIERVRTSSVSLMPEGLAQKLGPEKMRDLMTF